MNTVGRIGSYIGRGVSSVSGTFHPFGGAVDIIVVEQPDGSLKSSPWYVRFGKFQGVLKARENVVNIAVNGVEADFHMYLDGRGRAFFIKEVDIEDGDSLSSSSSSGEDTDGQTSSKRPTISKSCNYDVAESNSTAQINVSGENVSVRANSRRPGILGRVFGTKSMKKVRLPGEENDASIMRTDSLECAEMAADLLEMKWSTNLTPKRYNRDYVIPVAAQDMSKGVKEEDLQANDKKSDTSSLAHDNMLDNLDFREPACEKDDGSHPSFQTQEESVKVTGKHVFFPESENAARVSVVQDVEDYSREESLKISGDSGELGVVNADHDATGGTFISEVASPFSKFVDSPDIKKHDSFTVSRLPEEEHENAAVQSFFYCETEENSTTVLDVSTEEFTQNLCASRELEARMRTQTVLSMNDLMSKGNSQPEEDLLFEKDPSNGFKVITNNTYPNSISHFLVSDSGSLNSSAAKDFGCILPISCSSTSTDKTTSIKDKATGKLGASSEALGDPNGSSGSLVPLPVSSLESLEEEHLIFGDIDDGYDTVGRYTESTSSDYKENEDYPPASSGSPDINDYRVPNYESGPTLDKSIQSDLSIVADGRKLRTVLSNVDIPAIVQGDEVMRMGRSLPNMWSHDTAFPSIPEDLHSSIVLQTTEVAEFAKEVKNISATPEIERDPRSINSLGSSSSSWRSWSFAFKRSRSMKNSGLSMDEDVNTGKDISKNTGGNREEDVPRPKISKKKIMVTTPAPEQLATLNLKEGKNIVVFTFSTAMLGKQQVDARIYLWRWDSKVVISDVDGTITRSDVLGQFMPLVGRDWSQTGVAHLLSAIKENGYQLLFLSARSISQAYLTRQFLFNLMQDGKGLPEGPVVTSPDGLFLSLYREVVKRAPQEFKIACLQEIKALFPCDRNPFYAGFGNRDTDEICYLKVEIPEGKIFTINSKGQIVLKRNTDTMSYSCLHGCVNDLFPPMSSVSRCSLRRLTM
ncbi:phosphatidate phosphatase PAH2-like isoform X2 [Solanum verrucosum]|uniref:phosphatidate phosphatase PAH2-like isoform X2 n=1 Tax=Solanum verrucosum TaxID=315347 RepID=UPI0020D142B5|nr:phosphatidate phosphatase PAH2-like isoform X2 [Solanum verrucosum]